MDGFQDQEAAVLLGFYLQVVTVALLRNILIDSYI